MIYVFNSGLRGRYRQNVLNTLLLPDGCANRYRYRSRGDRVNINPQDREKLLRAKRGTDVAVVFIDRFSGQDYRYYPIRLGKLVACKEDGDQMFFFVKLESFLWSHAPDATSQRLRQHLDMLGIPRLTRGNPEETNDGHYAVIGESLFKDKDLFKWGDDAWEPAAKALSAMPAFTPSQEQPEFIVFARAQLLNSNGTRRQKPRVTRQGTDYFRLARGIDYVLHLRYMYPPQRTDPANEATLAVNASDSIRRLPESPVRINSFIETVTQRLAVKRFTEDAHASIDFHFSRDRAPGLLGSDASLQIQVVDARRFWLATFVAVVFFVIGGALTAMNVPAGQEATLKTFVAQLTTWKVIGAGIQAAMLFVLARLIGKKIL